MIITKLFSNFFNSEKTSGLILISCTVISLLVANSSMGSGYTHFWETDFNGHSITHWINDGLMSIFFLMIGLELEREIYTGELSDVKNALLPIVAALGGVVIPAGIYLILNGLERFTVELIRVNNTYTVFGFHPTQAEIISSLLVIGGLVLIIIARKRDLS